ncbi:FolB domain-containing protein [Paroceanicella profunda]|uniref:dihydroneopterin aldolase n=1 Tax=Paroceanicella profunda TaxID=2579971 RepID=A0A5B8FZJ5_9RHOB|nr:dihydroneopterin aldolase [Paroceanicella profunda]QDL92810.1 FolB domain-containing protein [Paroceanicella profunda]
MTEDPALAFEAPQARPGTARPLPLDRISVRDHVRSVEIGAFRSERGVEQRLRFNITLEVSHHAAAQDDDVDKVLSYDTILEALDTEIAAERINLLETLAERVAARCLADPRAVRAFVRIEKLDRIPGSLGVEIVRGTLPPDAQLLRPVRAEAPAPRPDAPRPLVLRLAGEIGADWIDALAACGRPVLLVPHPEPHRTDGAGPEGALRIRLLAMEQAAWRLAGGDARLTVTETRTEIDHALKSGRIAVWAPAHVVMGARPVPQDVSESGLAAWLAGTLGACNRGVLGAEEASAAEERFGLPDVSRFRAWAEACADTTA